MKIHVRDYSGQPADWYSFMRFTSQSRCFLSGILIFNGWIWKSPETMGLNHQESTKRSASHLLRKAQETASATDVTRSAHKNYLPFSVLLPSKPKAAKWDSEHAPSAQARHAEVKRWVERVQALERFIRRLWQVFVSDSGVINRNVGLMRSALPIGPILKSMPCHFAWTTLQGFTLRRVAARWKVALDSLPQSNPCVASTCVQSDTTGWARNVGTVGTWLSLKQGQSNFLGSKWCTLPGVVLDSSLTILNPDGRLRSKKVNLLSGRCMIGWHRYKQNPNKDTRRLTHSKADIGRSWHIALSNMKVGQEHGFPFSKCMNTEDKSETWAVLGT